MDLEWTHEAYKFVMMWLVKKFKEILKDFNVKWIPIVKNEKNHDELNCSIWKKKLY
jgi:hypothetical protein